MPLSFSDPRLVPAVPAAQQPAIIIQYRFSRFDKADQYADITALLALAFDLPKLAVSQERTQVKSIGYYRDKLNPLVDVLSMTFGMDVLKTGANKTNAAIQAASVETTVEGALLTLDNDTGYITAMIGGSKFDQSNMSYNFV